MNFSPIRTDVLVKKPFLIRIHGQSVSSREWNGELHPPCLIIEDTSNGTICGSKGKTDPVRPPRRPETAGDYQKHCQMINSLLKNPIFVILSETKNLLLVVDFSAFGLRMTQFELFQQTVNLRSFTTWTSCPYAYSRLPIYPTPRISFYPCPTANL